MKLKLRRYQVEVREVGMNRSRFLIVVAPSPTAALKMGKKKALKESGRTNVVFQSKSIKELTF